MTDDAIPTPAIGQIWREVDPREERYVKVIALMRDHAQIATAFKHSDQWKTMSGARWAKLSRFNGKRGGYEFVEDSNA